MENLNITASDGDNQACLSPAMEFPRLHNANAMKLWLDLNDILQEYDLEDVTDILELNSRLDWKDVRSLQQRSIKERAERHCVREQVQLSRKSQEAEWNFDVDIAGASLHVVVLNASTACVIGGIIHDIPIIVHSCVEALLRRGVYQSELFRILPNRSRGLELMDTFSEGPSYGDGLSLQNETIPDICALLVAFLDSLPHPLIDPLLYGPFWYWCIMPNLRRQSIKRKEQEMAEANERNGALKRGDKVPIIEFASQERPLLWTRDERQANEIKEQPQIAVAVILLKLLPIANLSLLVYLFNFFTQLPLCPENGIQLEDITRIFGHILIGGKSKSDAMKLMLWLLQRWLQISAALFSHNRTAWEQELQNASQSIGDHPSKPSSHLMESISRHHTSDNVLHLMDDRPRYGLYQFAPKGFPASRDLHALSQGMATQTIESNAGYRLTRRARSISDDIDDIEDWRVTIDEETCLILSPDQHFEVDKMSAMSTDHLAHSNAAESPWGTAQEISSTDKDHQSNAGCSDDEYYSHISRL